MIPARDSPPRRFSNTLFPSLPVQLAYFDCKCLRTSHFPGRTIVLYHVLNYLTARNSPLFSPTPSPRRNISICCLHPRIYIYCPQPLPLLPTACPPNHTMFPYVATRWLKRMPGRENALKQFVSRYRRAEALENDQLKWGDEVGTYAFPPPKFPFTHNVFTTYSRVTPAICLCDCVVLSCVGLGGVRLNRVGLIIIGSGRVWFGSVRLVLR